MAWEWSHTEEGMKNVADNIAKMDREKLNVIYAEWKGKKKNTDNLDQKKYSRALLVAGKMELDALVTFIQDRAKEQATCDNGGFDAWACPFGCGCHTASFSATDENGNVIEEAKEEE